MRILFVFIYVLVQASDPPCDTTQCCLRSPVVNPDPTLGVVFDSKCITDPLKPHPVVGCVEDTGCKYTYPCKTNQCCEDNPLVIATTNANSQEHHVIFDPRCPQSMDDPPLQNCVEFTQCRLGYAICFPEVLYVHRHAEMFQSGGEDAQEVLTPDGVYRAMSLSTKFFTERLPIQAIFVSEEYTRTLMTALFLASGVRATSITRYNVSDQFELARRIYTLYPCPMHIDIITHGRYIRGVFEAFGFNYHDIGDVIDDYGRFFVLNLRDLSVGKQFFGVQDSPGNRDWPGLVQFPTKKKWTPLQKNGRRGESECIPEIFYVHTTAERFIARLGDGRDDSQETLTPEGYMRSFALRDKFVQQQLQLEASFVAVGNIRSYLTAGPTIAETGITSVTRYLQEDEAHSDLLRRMSSMEPCPAHVQIVADKNNIASLIEALGFGLDDIDIVDFGQFFILVSDGNKVVSETFGISETQGNLPWPGLTDFDYEDFGR